MKPKVAIQCVVYNHEPYLRQCLDGFVMQQTNFPFIAVVHDDVSTDKSAEIIHEYADKYPDIIKPIFSQENKYSQNKLYPFMRETMDLIGAEYIAECEGDDYWTDPYKLQKQVDWLDAHKEYSLCCNTTKWLWNDNTFRDSFGLLSSSDVDVSTENIIEGGGLYLNLTSVVYRREIIHQKMINSKWWLMADVDDFPLYIGASVVGKIRFLAEPMSVYRFQHQGSWTATINQTNIKHISNEIEWLQLFDEETDRRYHKAIQKHLFPKFWRALYRNKCLSTCKYFKVYEDAGRPISYMRFIKDIIRRIVCR